VTIARLHAFPNAIPQPWSRRKTINDGMHSDRLNPKNAADRISVAVMRIYLRLYVSIAGADIILKKIAEAANELISKPIEDADAPRESAYTERIVVLMDCPMFIAIFAKKILINIGFHI
jgi:hypothetical protein